jgi:hypothetical protein
MSRHPPFGKRFEHFLRTDGGFSSPPVLFVTMGRHWPGAHAAAVRGSHCRLVGAPRRLGLPEGGRAVILALNWDPYHEYQRAVAWAGGVFVP